MDTSTPYSPPLSLLTVDPRQELQASDKTILTIHANVASCREIRIADIIAERGMVVACAGTCAPYYIKT